MNNNGNLYPYKGLYGFPGNQPLNWPYWENIVILNGAATTATTSVYPGILVPDNVYHMLGLVWGAGGSGASQNNQDGSSTGGGGGGFAAGILDVTPGTTLPDITVAHRTAAVTNAAGNNGNASSIGTLLVANGGSGGANGVGAASTNGGAGGTAIANTRIGFTANGGRGGNTSGGPATTRKATGGGGPGWLWCPQDDIGNGRNRGGDCTGNHSLAAGTGGGGLGGRAADANTNLTAVGSSAGGGLGGRGADHTLTSGNVGGAGGSRGNGAATSPTAGQGFIANTVTGGPTGFTDNPPNYSDIFRILINMFAFAGNGHESQVRRLREFYIGGWGRGTMDGAGSFTVAPGYGGGSNSASVAPNIFGGANGNSSTAAAITTQVAGDLAGGGGAAMSSGVGANTVTCGSAGIAGGGGGARSGTSQTGTCTSGAGGPGLVILAWTVGY